jgi:O-acetyl-ADP-ribose deacetylase (regulator of RNase III)
MNSIRILLKSLDPEMVSAWEESFSAFDNVVPSFGDIMLEQADAIISPANSFGYMDGGIDLVYSKFFGWDLEKRLRAKLLDEYYGELPVGQAVLVETGHQQFKYLISAPTMRVPMNIEKTANVYLAFRAVLDVVKRYNQINPNAIRSIACPALGTGEGKMSFSRCATQMLYAYFIVVLGHREEKGGLANAVRNHIQIVE